MQICTLDAPPSVLPYLMPTLEANEANFRDRTPLCPILKYLRLKWHEAASCSWHVHASPQPERESSWHLSWACPRHRAGGPPRRAASHQSWCVTSHRNQKKMEWSCCGTRMCSGLSSTNAGTQHSQRMCVHVLALLSQSGKWTDVVAIFSFRNKMFPGFVCLKSQGLVWNLAVCHTGERRMSFKEVKKTC